MILYVDQNTSCGSTKALPRLIDKPIKSWLYTRITKTGRNDSHQLLFSINKLPDMGNVTQIYV
jgi:hypothetical protein